MPKVPCALLLLHVPPAVASVRVVVKPTQTAAVPKIGVGNGFTVTIAVTISVDGKVYVITDVPAVTPVTMPEDDPTVTLPLPLLHVPSPPASVNAVVDNSHTLRFPFITGKVVLTVTMVVVEQPVPNV